MKVRLNKFIANTSKYSRRKADEIIQQGLVAVNGKPVLEMGILIDDQIDKVTIDNAPLTIKSDFTYLALNKPSGYITSRSDEFDRATIMDILPKNLNLKPVGRLDRNSEGLILVSNDGAFINKFTHPKFNCQKEYLVTLETPAKENEISKLEQGIEIDGYKTKPCKIQTITAQKFQIIIYEGRNRQIRKMFASINHPVKYLKRIRIDKILLGDLPLGKYRNLTQEELHAD